MIDENPYRAPQTEQAVAPVRQRLKYSATRGAFLGALTGCGTMMGLVLIAIRDGAQPSTIDLAWPLIVFSSIGAFIGALLGSIIRYLRSGPTPPKS
jgi:hypothetical protein